MGTFVEQMPGIPWIRVVEGDAGGGRTMLLGPQVERILGYAPEELLGEPSSFGRLIHPEDRARIRRASITHDRTEEPWSEEFRVVARDGRVIWLHSEGAASRDSQGRLVWHGVAFDITSTKQRTIEVPEIAPSKTES